MRVQLAFGKTGISLELPPGFEYGVFSTRSAPPAADAIAAIETSLNNPVDAPPLAELARGRRSVAIAVCDITRPAPNQLVLPPVLARLHAAGITADAVTILIATGLHRGATPEEVRQIVGPEIAARYCVFSHDARALSEHESLGITAPGTPVFIDRRFVSADLRVTLGLIEPHLMAGFSGGRKLIAPGLAAQRTIEALHSPKFMRDPRVVEGSYASNPLHQELLEIARRVRHDFIVDTVLTPARGIAAVFAGHPEAAHRRGVESVFHTILQELPTPVDAVITTGAGYPLDLTFYQAIKGVTAASHLVKDGGKILLLAACDEGPGAAEFSRMLQTFSSDRAFLEYLNTHPVAPDQWQLEKLALVTQRAEVLFYVPGLTSRFRNCLWGRSFASAAQALSALTSALPRGARIAILPEGPYVLARVAARAIKATSGG